MKKKTLLSFLIVLTLCFFALAGCSINNQSTPSESSPESNVESTPIYSIPFVELDLTSTTTSVILEINEHDFANKGEITEIKIKAKGASAIYAENTSVREFTDLYSNTEYTVSVTYVYNVGFGEESDVYSKKIKTLSLSVPTVDVTYESKTYNSIDFDLNLTDEDAIASVEQIKLVPEDENASEIVLKDLNSRQFKDIASGNYQLIVSLKYDLNLGYGETVKEFKFKVSTLIDPFTIPDFIVEVEEGREPVILQLTDTQIIDSSQQTPGRLSATHTDYWGKYKMQDRLFNYMRETVAAVKPDLIVMTGDNVYGEFDNNGSAYTALINEMESYNIPWAPIFGNHDNESKKGVDWQCAQFEAAEHCLFKQRTLTGNGNYTVGIKQGDKLTRVFFMLDSNGCGNVSQQSLANGHTTQSVGFARDQIEWFLSVGDTLNTHSPATKITFAFHIQIAMFETAYAKYGFTDSDSEGINIDTHPNKVDGDFGYLGRGLKGEWDKDFSVYNKIVSIGTDSILVGHEHCNSASVVHEGVRFQFGQKIGTYDRANWMKPDGTIVGADYPPVNGSNPIMGGSVMVLDSDGTISNAYIYYCQN